jgi:flagellar protein FliS
MQTAARAYLKTQVNTTSQGDLLILLYEGALKYLAQAKEKIAVRDYAAKGILISRALDILNELQSSLNAQKGGELADNLQKLYFYCSTRLLLANLKMDIAIIDEVVRILSGLSEAFRTANAEVSGRPVPERREASPPAGHDGSYGVPPPSMAQKPAPSARAGIPAAFPGFAKRPRPAEAPAPSMPGTPDAGSEPVAARDGLTGTDAVAGNPASYPAARPTPARKVPPGGAAPPPPEPQPRAQSPLRRAFAAYATARDQKTAS